MTLAEQNSLFQKIEKNIFQNFKHLPKLIGKPVVQYDDMTMVSCGFTTLSFNLICDTHIKDKSYEDMVSRADEFYGKTPYMWWLSSPKVPSNFNIYLQSRGFFLFSLDNAMIYDLTKHTDLPALDTLRIEQVTTMQHLEDFTQILSAFDSKIDTVYINELLISKKNLDVNPLFVGYIDNQPIATAALYIQNKIASLHDLVTKESFRNKSVGTDMVKHLIKFVKSKGINQLCLTTNQNPAFNLYNKMGFKFVDKFECYLSHEKFR